MRKLDSKNYIFNNYRQIFFKKATSITINLPNNQ